MLTARARRARGASSPSSVRARPGLNFNSLKLYPLSLELPLDHVVASPAVETTSGRDGYAALAFPTVNRVSMARLHGRLTAENGGFRPGQSCSSSRCR